MADLRLARGCAVVNLPVHDQPATNATAKRDVENGIQPDTHAARCLAKRRHVRVVVHGDRHIREPVQPSGQVKPGPTFDLMRTRHPAGFPIHRPAEANADGGDFAAPQEVRDGTFDLLTDPRRPLRGGTNSSTRSVKSSNATLSLVRAAAAASVAAISAANSRLVRRNEPKADDADTSTASTIVSSRSSR